MASKRVRFFPNLKATKNAEDFCTQTKNQNQDLSRKVLNNLNLGVFVCPLGASDGDNQRLI
jgi:hypothetical protein